MSFAQPIPLARPVTTGGIALFVDGENLPPLHAGRILTTLGGRANIGLARVYGDMGRAVWAGTTGFRLVHAGSGKNAADLLLCIEAMAAWHGGQFATMAIATSDRDFTHLALWLREAGAEVVGFGEAKAPAALRHACSRWIDLVDPAAKPMATLPAAPNPSRQDETLEDLLFRVLGTGTLSIAEVNMAVQGRFQVSKSPEKTWARWLAARPHRFRLEGCGTEARVHRA